MRTLCIDSFNKEYELYNTLAEKRKGRNRDFLVSQMDNYQEMKEKLKKHQDNLNKANEKSIKLDNNSNEVKDIVENLKNSFGSKDKYTLKQEDKNKIINYIEQVNDTNNDYKKMTKLSNTLNNVDEELKSAKSIKEENDALTIRNASLEKQIIVKDEEIDNLKEENSTLINELKKWKNKFLKVINFIKSRLSRQKDKEKYEEFTVDLYTHGAIDRETFNDIKDNYSKGKRKDDFEH